MPLDIILPENTPIQKIITCTIEGILEQEDINFLISGSVPEESRKAGKAPTDHSVKDIQKIREKHHTVARLIAGGLNQRMVATIAGYTESYLSTMLNAPAMEELIAYYSAKHSNAHEVIIGKLRGAGMEALEKLSEKLKDDDMSNTDLIALAKLGLDRSGHGPSSTQHQITEEHVFNYAELKRLNKAAQKSSSKFVTKVQPALLTQEAKDETD